MLQADDPVQGGAEQILLALVYRRRHEHLRLGGVLLIDSHPEPAAMENERYPPLPVHNPAKSKPILQNRSR
jgi:hypothetical protein